MVTIYFEGVVSRLSHFIIRHLFARDHALVPPSQTLTTPICCNSLVFQVDADAQKMMETLRKDKILRSSIDVRNISYFRIKWNDVENRNPSDDPEYLERFCDAFCTKVGKIAGILRSVHLSAWIYNKRLCHFVLVFHRCEG